MGSIGRERLSAAPDYCGGDEADAAAMRATTAVTPNSFSIRVRATWSIDITITVSHLF